MDSSTGTISNLEELLTTIAQSVHGEYVSLKDILKHIGDRSFAPLILIAGMVMASPGVGDIPGVPILMGLLTVLVSGQMLVGRTHIWLPAFLLNRRIKKESLHKSLTWLYPPARMVDRFIRPRLTIFTGKVGSIVILLACSAISLTTPAMEIVLLSANVAGVALVAFGLALLARDGLLAIIAFLLTAGTAAAIVFTLL